MVATTLWTARYETVLFIYAELGPLLAQIVYGDFNKKVYLPTPQTVPQQHEIVYGDYPFCLTFAPTAFENP